MARQTDGDIQDMPFRPFPRNRRMSERGGMDSPIEIVRQDSEDDLYYGDDRFPRDPMNYLPGPGRGEKK